LKPLISIITSYYDRPKRLFRYNAFIKTVNNPNIEFILREWPFPDEVFSTAKCHNSAVEDAEGKWILKMDLDCSFELSMIDKIIDLVKDKDYKFFANFGCKSYLGDIGFPQGNQYLCSKQAYIDIGGEAPLDGYGCEDYLFLYMLTKYQKPGFKLEYEDQESLYVSIRDNIARKLNQKYKDIYFSHQYHERNTKLTKYMDQNKRKMFEICNGLDSD
jgi:hypothetical protein